MDSNWELVGKIGEGTYGIVHLLRHVDRKSTAQVAVKTFKVRRQLHKMQTRTRDGSGHHLLGLVRTS